MKGGMWRMHAFSHTSYHIISPTGIHSTDTQQHRDATHTYTRTYIHAHRCMYMSRYVAYLLHPFIAFFIHIYDYMTLYRELGTVRPLWIATIRLQSTERSGLAVWRICSRYFRTVIAKRMKHV